MLKERSYAKELMDDLEASGEVVHRTLRELEVINKRLGGNYVTLNGLERLLGPQPPKSRVHIADLGCGGGDILKLIAGWARKKGVRCHLHGVDANPHIIAYARENCRGIDNITFEVRDIFSEDFKQQDFDIVCCTLFTHHFTDEMLLDTFRQFSQQARLGVVINDLHRHWLALYAITLLTWLFSRSAMVKHDAPLSVRRSFKRKDLRQLMHQAGIRQYTLRWMWAFRWQLLFRGQGRL